MSRDYAKGSRRVELIFTSDPFTELRPGDEGTVSFIDGMGTVHVDWDNGSKLGLVPGEDQWREFARATDAADATDKNQPDMVEEMP